MADELNKNAEFSGKHQDEEDPILTAQRYLNIYRQIHIFNQKRQEEFDESLLALSPDLRILLSTLPGGSLLLDHITQLEEKRGIINFEKPASSSSKRKSSKSSHKEESSSSYSKTNNKTADTSFGADNILQVLEQNEEKHSKELQALTNAFIQSQERMVNILQQVLERAPAQQIITDEIKPQKQPEKAISEPENKDRQMSSEKEEILTVQDSTPEPKSEQKNVSEPETSSKILSFTKKLFHKSSEEPETPKLPSASETAIQNNNTDILIDNTPVSLDDINDSPITLDVPEVSKKTEAKAEQLYDDLPKQEPEASQADEDWDWEYIDDEDASDDMEWEYIEEPEDETIGDISASADNTNTTSDALSDDDYIYEEIEEPSDTHETTVEQNENNDETANEIEPTDDLNSEVQEPVEDIQQQYSEQPNEDYDYAEDLMSEDATNQEYTDQPSEGQQYSEQPNEGYDYVDDLLADDGAEQEYLELPDTDFEYTDNALPDDNANQEYDEQYTDDYQNTALSDDEQQHDDTYIETTDDEQV
ncbi:MAG: hypothetical protein J5896_04100 [Alphaproteobacteria bacterium]|nr:hypothetical protein [Alphaproteobacteria bacterium]